MKTKILEDILQDLPPYKPEIFPPRKSSRKPRFVRTELSPSEMEALETVTGYSEEQISVWFKQFQKECPQGVLTRKKMINIYDRLGKAKSASLVDNILTIFDKDRRGYLLFEEFLEATSQSEIGSPEIKLKWQFELYDEDKSGNINEEEFVQIFVQIFDGEDTGKPKTEEERDAVIEKAKEMFSELDDSGDGEMSLDEFVEGCMKDEDLVKMLSET